MAIIGAHMLLYSSEPEALLAALRDAFGFESVDAGGGWLIFGLPPAELGVHPADGHTAQSGARHQLSFMCDDIHKTIADLRGKGIEINGEPANQGWGVTAIMKLPGDVDVMLYQPRHPVAIRKPNP